jgi:hypothetical protein
MPADRKQTLTAQWAPYDPKQTKQKRRLSEASFSNQIKQTLLFYWT